MIVLIWTAVLIAVLMLYLRKSYSRFSDHGVKNPGVVPFFGNMSRVFFGMDSFATDLDMYYNNFPEERFVGKYEFLRPTLIVRDLDVVKKIMIKDFDYFLDHRGFTDEKGDPLFSRNLFSLKGHEWRDMRSTLSPAFTSAKIKLMVPFMEEVGEQMIRALKKKINDSPKNSIDIDCKDLTTRYGSDVIASCAFGLKVDSLAHENNKFFLMGKNASGFLLRQIIIFFIMSACPIVANKLKLTLWPKKTQDFFIDLVLSTMKDREARRIIRPDMIHLLMEAKKGRLSHEDKDSSEKNNSDCDAGFATVEESDVGKKKTDRVWSDIDLVAQATIFLIAGFEGVSMGMSFALHELALHPDVQGRLYREIKEHDVKNGGKLSYTSIQDMTYLDMVVSEVLRMWPPGFALDRVCVKDYNMGRPNAKSTQDYIVRKGEIIWAPTWCFHHDPKYFPNPEKFDPERFSDENKHLINPMAYIPFGLGPRNCIGSRFALCEIKVFLYQILLHFEVSPSVKLQLPARLSVRSFNPRLAGGHWATFKLRA
ncbi:cytochrome P450 9e2-like [Maniola hyperantus]|uniref:cytochrome P450 9e2-like n=1 Tax=Aphantopus hyperantus TaxID=2795564 RepID=UPI00156A4FDC|nr:cytochrome P450 9e2-like isoform X3 [Maniola hyperantus]